MAEVRGPRPNSLVSDFADAAHLTRTFYQMFGITPSAFMQGDFFAIGSPFDLLEQAA